ncbi:MAG: type II secretion system F family protein [Armatimonadetes bacterium]|nr:type II secretion system F family protein [Armatimonadota bacterium]
MPVFTYTAQREDGQTVSGTALGDSFETVAGQLKSQGMTVLSLAAAPAPGDPVVAAPSPLRPEQPRAAAPPPTEARSTFATQVAGPIVGQVSLSALHFFFRQLGTMLNAGINPADALETLSRQTGSPKLMSIVRETKEHVIAGRPISVGLHRYPEVFNPLMMSMVRVGEEGGFLADQCSQLSEYIQRDMELRNTIKRETAMPKLTVGASLVIIFGANATIQAVAPGGLTLPTPWIVWLAAAALAIGAFLFVKFFLPRPQVRRAFDEFVLNLPGVGPMVHGFAMAKFGRAFGALYRGGVAIPKAVVLSAEACGNEAVRARVVPAAARIEGGASITETFTATGAFSPLVLDMARTGETTGNMDEMLLRMSEFYEDEGITKAQMAAKIIGVLALVAVGAYVLFILVSFYSSYFGRMTSS